MDTGALQLEMLLCGEGKGAMGTACAAAASRLCGRAFLVLAISLCAATLFPSSGALAALPQPPRGSPPCSPAWSDSTASWQERSDNLVVACGDLHKEYGRVLGGAVGTPGYFPGVEDVAYGTDAEGLVSRALITATASSLSARTSLQWQPSSRHKEGLRVGTAVVATSAQLLQTMADTSPSSWHPSALGGLCGTTSGSHDATQLPVVTLSHGFGQPADIAEPQSLGTPGVPAHVGASWSPTAVGQPGGDPTLPFEVSHEYQTMPHREDPCQAASSEPSTVVTAGILSSRGTVTASLPSVAFVQDVNHPQEPISSLPPAESRDPAATSGIWNELSFLTVQTFLTSSEAPPSLAQSRAPSAASPTVAGVSLAVPDTTPQPEAAKAPCKGGAVIVASPSPRAAGVTCGSSLGSSTWQPTLHPQLCTRASEDGAAAGQHLAVTVAEISVERAGHSEPRAVLVGPTAVSAGASVGTDASPGYVPSPSFPSPWSEAVYHTSTSSLPSTSYLLTATGASSTQTLAASSVSSPSIHPSAARDCFPAATGEAFISAELMAMGKCGSPGMKVPGLPSSAQPVHVLPLWFRLVGITYSEALSNKASQNYRDLEEEVRLMLNQLLSAYETFLQANVLEFMNGSVLVRGEALFRGDVPAPTNSHLIRTVITEASRKRNIFSWQLEPQSVQSSGFSLKNLDPEKLSISLTVFQFERDRTDPLERLTSKVTWSLEALYKVRNFTIVQLRNLSGELDITGDIYLDTIIHADVAKVLQALTALATCSVDLTSLSVEGAKLDLQVYPVSFLITNRRFSEDFLDPLAVERQEIIRVLGDVVTQVLMDHRSYLQVVIREFLPGSLICHGDVVFQHPAPTSLEVLEALVLSVGPDKTLAGSDFQVDLYSLAVGEATLEPPQSKPGFPVYGVAILVVCSLCVVIAPIILLVCLRTKRLGQWYRVALWDRRDPEAGTQTLEMDNRGF